MDNNLRLVEGFQNLSGQGVGAGFEEGEAGQGLARDEPLVAELDEAVRDARRAEPEVLGLEFFAAAPVADADVAQDSPAAHRLEEGKVVVVGLGHGCGCWRLRVGVDA